MESELLQHIHLLAETVLQTFLIKKQPSSSQTYRYSIPKYFAGIGSLTKIQSRIFPRPMYPCCRHKDKANKQEKSQSSDIIGQTRPNYALSR